MTDTSSLVENDWDQANSRFGVQAVRRGGLARKLAHPNVAEQSANQRGCTALL